MTKTNDLTEGNISRVLLGFFFPMLFTNLLQQLYIFADSAIVGKGLGDNVLAAVGNMSGLTLLVIGFGQGITNGFSVIIAQQFGRGNTSALRISVAASLKLSAVLSAILTVLSLVFLKDVLCIMHTDAEIIEDSLIYGYILFGGLTATISYNLFSGILRALGDSKTPLLAIIISSFLNILLDCLFIFVLKTGVGGAAIATVLAQAVSVGICVVHLRKEAFLHFSRDDFKTDVPVLLVLIKNGLPMAFMNSVTALGCMTVQSYINALGVVYTSAYSVCSKYVNLFMLPSVTAGFTVSTFTSQNYGAGKFGRICAGVRVCLMIGFVSYLLLGGLMLMIPETLAGLLLNSQQTIALAGDFLKICGIMFFTLNFLFVYRSAVQGMGKPFVPMCSGFLEMALRILVIAQFLVRIGFKAAAYAEGIAWSGALVVNLAVYTAMMRKYTKRRKEGV